MTDKELQDLIERSFGFSDEQALEELEAAEKEVTEEECTAGNFNALLERIWEIKKRQKPDE